MFLDFAPIWMGIRSWDLGTGFNHYLLYSRVGNAWCLDSPGVCFGRSVRVFQYVDQGPTPFAGL